MGKLSVRLDYCIENGGSVAIASFMTADFMKNGGIKTYSPFDL